MIIKCTKANTIVSSWHKAAQTMLKQDIIIARNKRTRAYIFRILLRLRYRRSQWQTLGAWYKASALGRYVRGICPPIIV